jgi:hypothetical protein
MLSSATSWYRRNACSGEPRCTSLWLPVKNRSATKKATAMSSAGTVAAGKLT